MADTNNYPTWPGWETIRLIGRGSYGAVYEIQRDVFGETEKAALKVISIPQNSSDLEEFYSEGYDEESITTTFKEHLRNIVAEYSLMRKMNGSANVVNCDDMRYVQHDNEIGWDIYIRMELLTPLPKAYDKDISDEQVIRVGTDICKALALCKKHNIIHRDIKPQNIFLSPNGDYKLGDFGIAKTVEKTSGGTKIGTYEYMAPEVYHDQPYGSTVDIYSLGMVLYWLLNERRTPFLSLPPALPTTAEKEQARKRRLRGDELPPPAHGSEELKRIVLKACAYDPGDRYQTAEEMLQALTALVDFRGPVESDGPAVSSPRDDSGSGSRSGPVGTYVPGGDDGSGQDDEVEVTWPENDEDGAETVGAWTPEPDDGDATMRTVRRGGRSVPEGDGTSDAGPADDYAGDADIDPPPGATPVFKEEKPKKKKKPLLIALIAIAAAAALAVIGYFNIHFWSPATCTRPEKCTLCGKTRGKAMGHKWKAATCTDPETCVRCGKTRGAAKGHSWKAATCTQPKTCTRCGATEGTTTEHSWKAATCTQPETCSVCGATRGSAKGHSWKAATCTQPETCTRCSATRGSALGHSWTAATYTKPKTCTRCGAQSGGLKGYIGTLSGSWASKSLKVNNTQTAAMYQLNSKVTNCFKLTLKVEFTKYSGHPYGTWYLYARGSNGKWSNIGSFELTQESIKSPITVNFRFDPAVTFDALAIYRKGATQFSVSYRISFTDAQQYVD